MENWEKEGMTDRLKKSEEVIWINPDKKDFNEYKNDLKWMMADIEDAEKRLDRFAPFIAANFPETKVQNGLIESALTEIPSMKEHLEQKYGSNLPGRLFLKQDSHLAIAGSVKARGGIYEILKHTEDLAIGKGLLSVEDDYSRLSEPIFRELFSKYTIQVGSTGNLGLSIGIISAAIGYQVIVHMSADARQWKKDLLRSRGVTVMEYASDYSGAVKNGRRLSEENPNSYFVDDENSETLFLGYAVAAKRLKKQLQEQKIIVDKEHPLFVYIPCGVGGAPGGITFGLKQVFQDAVHCFFVEPTEAPCMLLGMATGKHHAISVQDIGLSGKTHADGLAVSRPSGFVGPLMQPMLSGEWTIRDRKLYDYMRDLLEAEELFLEPSACAAFQGIIKFNCGEEMKKYLQDQQLEQSIKNAVHIAWATGGGLVPQNIQEEYKNTFL